MASTSVNPEIKALEKEIAAAAEAAPVAGQAAPQTIELNLAGGQVFKGTQEEVLKKLAEAQNHATVTLAERKQEIEDLKVQIAQRSAPVSEGSTSYNDADYWRLWEKDPMAAANYLDGHRFNMAPENVVQAITSTYEISQQVNDQMQVARFMQTASDFPGGQEASEKLLRHLDSSGRPLTADNLAISFMELKNTGQIVAVDAEGRQEAPNRPNPTLSGGGSVHSDESNIASMANQLTDAQLEAMLRKKGLL